MNFLLFIIHHHYFYHCHLVNNKIISIVFFQNDIIRYLVKDTYYIEAQSTSKNMTMQVMSSITVSFSFHF